MKKACQICREMYLQLQKRNPQGFSFWICGDCRMFFIEIK